MDKDYELCEPFDIDNGELDNLSPQECFVLGVEWQMIAELADIFRSFEHPIHSNNKNRIEKLLQRRKRQYTIQFMHDDISESWLWLKVQSKDDTQS